MLLISTYVAPSSIEGSGMYSDEYVPCGSLIWSLNPKFDVFVNEIELGSLLRMCGATSPAIAILIWKCRAAG
jgi:hypothetical protein